MTLASIDVATQSAEVPQWAFWILGIVAALIAAAIPAALGMLWSINNRMGKMETDIAVLKVRHDDDKMTETRMTRNERNIARVADRVGVDLLD